MQHRKQRFTTIMICSCKTAYLERPTRKGKKNLRFDGEYFGCTGKGCTIRCVFLDCIY